MVELFPAREIAITVLGFSVHWYGIMYMLGFIQASYLLPRLQSFRGISLSKDEWSNILIWSIAGVLLGGRLGYVLFYEFDQFSSNPLYLFAIRDGGMSSHGGFVGVLIALYCALRKHTISKLAFADVAVVPIAIGLALGRLGNFINLELYGIPTMLPWAIEIPGVEHLRHPTQVYAILKNLANATVCYALLVYVKPQIAPGKVCAVFLGTYAVLRFCVEYLRVETHTSAQILSAYLTRGQVLSVPILLVAIVLWIYAEKKSGAKSTRLSS